MVDTILAQTAIVNKDDKMEEGEATDAWSAEQASKIILTGQVVTISLKAVASFLSVGPLHTILRCVGTLSCLYTIF